MKLEIRKIIIEKNEKITESHLFFEGLSVVKGSAALYDIIRLLLGKKEAAPTFHNVRFFAEVKLQKTYYIRGSKKRNEKNFNVTVFCEESDRECCEDYFKEVQQNEEMESALFFHRFKRQDYPHKLVKYRDLFRYYPNGDFSTLTNGYGTTRSFRGFMTHYINNFEPIKLRHDKELFLKLTPDGEFKVGYLGSEENIYLSETENVLYHFLSFINIADFWDRCERIRNMHSLKKPLVVSMLLEKVDDSVDISEILKKAASLNRQTILFSEKK